MEANSTQERKPNRLINEKSPYLLQHAYNPVEWHPYNQAALEKAKTENKPIFLSIGYSTCHWCHVMEKECFEDQEVADLMNKAFVSIKVDREERPDLDAAYMAVCQAMGRNCGWPLNVLLTPSLNPFFAASYIPKQSRPGSMGMLELIPQITTIWKMSKSQLEIVGADIKSRLEAMETRTPAKDLGTEILQIAYSRLAQEFDSENGGFGYAPKFPRPHSLMFLLRYWKRSGEKNALNMAEKTLRQMRIGGIFDQIGFGFHRYSTDAIWLVPHFEKMLYDQALLALAYTEAYQATGAPKFKLSAKETLDYVLRDLLSPEGGFYTAEDADSEGKEGKFYLWTLKEIVDLLPPADADLAVHLFDVSTDGNFLDDTGNKSGENILHLPTPLADIASYKGLTIDELIMRLGSIRNQFFEARSSRVRPGKDDKVLTDWNGLMVAALTKASAVLNEPRYLKAAKQTANFLLGQMRSDHNGLYHRFAKGERSAEGFLDDYAFLVFGLIELYEATFEEKYLQIASELAKEMIQKFWDKENGGFYFSEQKPSPGMPKMKQIYDGAVPSGNSVAVLDLLRLSRLLNEETFESKAHDSVKVFSTEIQSSPEAFTWFLAGVDFAVGPSCSVTLIGNIENRETVEMLVALRKHYLPNVVVTLKTLKQAGLGFSQIEGKTTAYVCRDQTCLPATNNIDALLELVGVPKENR